MVSFSLFSSLSYTALCRIYELRYPSGSNAYPLKCDMEELLSHGWQETLLFSCNGQIGLIQNYGSLTLDELNRLLSSPSAAVDLYRDCILLSFSSIAVPSRAMTSVTIGTRECVIFVVVAIRPIIGPTTRHWSSIVIVGRCNFKIPVALIWKDCFP